MKYVLVFDAAHAGPRGTGFIVVCIIFVVVGLFFVAVSRKAPTPQKRTYRGVFGLAFLLLGAVTSWAMYRDYNAVSDYTQARVVDGLVSSFKPMPTEGHAMESFCVQSKCFYYSDYVVTPGFNNTSSHGGPIKLGIHVRVTYVGNTILKLEIAR